MLRIRRIPAALLGAALLATGLTGLAGPASAAAPQLSVSHATRTALFDAMKQAQRHDPAERRHICYAAHVQDTGWQTPVCDGAVAGTVGRSLRMEALAILVFDVGGVCAAAHLHDGGWEPRRCVGDSEELIVGTTGRSQSMEALAISVSTGFVCADAQVQDIGWQGERCARDRETAVVGTTGRNLRMEAVKLTV
jgi:hypothetical protein